jgi:two-component system copper resistance phosphate regulon response regulator CusR
MRILVIEDEAKAAKQLKAGLELAHFQTELAGEGNLGFRLASSGTFDALVVDVMLPGLNGLELVEKLRKAGVDTPVLFLSAKGTLEDRLRGLKSGGDDYIVKPYAFPEVLARLQAILRRVKPSSPLPPKVEVADLTWEPDKRRITRMGKRVDLTPKEYLLAALLMENVGQVVPRSTVVETVWGLTAHVDPNAVDVQVRRLRAKLDDPYERKLVHTLRGVGIVLEDRG